MSELHEKKQNSKISELLSNFDKNTYHKIRKKKNNEKDILIDSFNECSDLRNSLQNSLDNIVDNFDTQYMNHILKHDNSFSSLKIPTKEQRKILTYNKEMHLTKNNSVSKYDIKTEKVPIDINSQINHENQYYYSQKIQNNMQDMQDIENVNDKNGQKAYEYKMYKKIIYNNNNNDNDMGNYDGEKNIKIIKKQVIHSGNEYNDEINNVNSNKNGKGKDKILNSIFDEIVKVKGDEILNEPDDEINNKYDMHSKTFVTSRKEKALNYDKDKDIENDESYRSSNTNANTTFNRNSIRKSQKREKEKKHFNKNQNIIEDIEIPVELNNYSGKCSPRNYKYKRVYKYIQTSENEKNDINQNNRSTVEDVEPLDNGMQNIKSRRDINKNQINNKIIYRKTKRYYNDEEDSKNSSLEVKERKRYNNINNNNYDKDDDNNYQKINKEERIIILSSKDKNKDLNNQSLMNKDITNIKEIKEIKELLLGQDKPINIKQNFDFEIKIDFNEKMAKKGKKHRIEIESEQLK